MVDRSANDNGGGPVEPDTMLASQFFGRLRSSERSGERRLMVAVLEEGVLTYLKYLHATDPNGRALFKEAAAWIESSDNDLMAFETLCQAVGLEPDYVRRGLRMRTRRPDADAPRIEVPDEERRRAHGA